MIPTTLTRLRPGPLVAEWRPAAPRFVVSDLDGTFLEADDTVAPGLAEAVAATVRAGVRFGFATGRLPRGLPELGVEGPGYGPHIVHNGSQVLGGEDPARTDRVTPLAPEHVTRLLEVCRRRDLYAEFFTAEGMLATRDDPRVRLAWERLSGPPIRFTDGWDGRGAIKATLVDFDADGPESLLAEFDEAGLTTEASTSPLVPGAWCLNATAGVTKGSALCELLARLGIRPEETVVIGDGLNDLSMFPEAGTAIAVESAPAELRARAHLIAPEPAPVLAVLRELVLDR